MSEIDKRWVKDYYNEVTLRARQCMLDNDIEFHANLLFKKYFKDIDTIRTDLRRTMNLLLWRGMS